MPDMKPEVSFVSAEGRKSLEKAGQVTLKEDMGSVKTIRKS